MLIEFTDVNTAIERKKEENVTLLFPIHAWQKRP